MRVLHEIGEIGLHGEGREALLRPSFYAMSTLGTPEEIVEKYVTLHAPLELVQVDIGMAPGLVELAVKENHRRAKEIWNDTFWLAHSIITACCDDDLTYFIGEAGERYNSYRPGAMPVEDIVTIARSLMRHGIIGPEPKNREPDAPRQDSDYTSKFDASKYVYKAVADLGLSEDQAWNMTLSGFAAAMEAKHGEGTSEKDSQNHDDTMNWLESVNRARAEKQKNGN